MSPWFNYLSKQKGHPFKNWRGAFFFAVILCNNKGGIKLAKSNYNSNKRYKELERKIKQEQKRQRKKEKKQLNSNEQLIRSQNIEEN